MAARPGSRRHAAIHVELFVTARRNRGRLRRSCRDLYARVRPATARAGGDGPWLYLLSQPTRPLAWPEHLRRALGVRPDEDLWLELAFYPSIRRGRTTIRTLRKDPEIGEKAAAAEGYNLRRRRSWTISNGDSQPV